MSDRIDFQTQSTFRIKKIRLFFVVVESLSDIDDDLANHQSCTKGKKQDDDDDTLTQKNKKLVK